MEPLKFSIAVALINPLNGDEVLVVKRPENDDSLPGVWGLPAVTTLSNELPEEAIIRLGFEKLNVKIKPVSLIGVKYAKRDAFDLVLMEVFAKLEGDEPSVLNATTKSTKYIEQKWTSDFSILFEAARNGSLCSQIFLESKGLSWKMEK